MTMCATKGGENHMATQENGQDEDKGTRISITIDPSLRRNMRIAAAFADLSVGEWAVEVLRKASEKAAPEVTRRARS